MKRTITSKAQIERLFHEGRRFSSPLMTVICLPSSHEGGACMFVAGKKLGSAPLRNRCKRVMRHVSSELGAPWDGHDVVFVAKRGIAHEEHDRVCRSMGKLLRRAGVAL